MIEQKYNWDTIAKDMQEKVFIKITNPLPGLQNK
jgi:hypothetical protein